MRGKYHRAYQQGHTVRIYQEDGRITTQSFTLEDGAVLPIALTVNFAAPIADGNIDVVVRLVRTNRSTQHWLVEASQNGVVVALATAVFAERVARRGHNLKRLPPMMRPLLIN